MNNFILIGVKTSYDMIEDVKFISSHATKQEAEDKKTNICIDKERYNTKYRDYITRRRKYLTYWIDTNLENMFDVNDNPRQANYPKDIVKTYLVSQVRFNCFQETVEEELLYLLSYTDYRMLDIKLIKNSNYVAPKFDYPKPEIPPFFSHDLFILETK